MSHSSSLSQGKPRRGIGSFGLAAGRRVIALDPRGMGDFDRPASGYEMRTVAAELHDFVEALKLTANGPVDIVGHARERE